MRYAVIMAGGSGTRFWPLSRQNKPKQFLAIAQERTLIQETVFRLKEAFPPERVLIVTQERQVSELKKQLPQIPVENILIEPEGRDTAAAIALATLFCAHQDPDATLVVMPADHIIQPPVTFLSDLDKAFLACQGSIVTLGIPPTSPHTGYGYIQRGETLAEDLFKVQRFVEKPDKSKATEYLQAGDYYWNAGIFIFHQKTMMDAFEKHMKSFSDQLQKIRESIGTNSFTAALEAEYPKLQKISIDFGIMEKFSPIKVLATHFEWDDVGSLTALARYGKTDPNKNVIYGNCLVVESEGILAHSKDHLVATLGLKDIAIIHTEDATLIAPKSRLEELKKVVENLKESKHNHLL